MARHMRARRYLRFKIAIAILVFIGGLSLAVACSLLSGQQMPASTQMPAAEPVATLSADAIRPTSSPTKSSQTPKASAPAVKKVDLAPAPPTRVEIPSAKINFPIADLPAESITDTANGRVINPPLDPTFVYWISAGGMPGEQATTYLTSHSSADGSQWPLNAISDSTLVKVGDPVRITTKNGTFSYTISKLLSLPRADFAETEYADLVEKDEIVIASCYTHDLYKQTRVLVAQRLK